MEPLRAEEPELEVQASTVFQSIWASGKRVIVNEGSARSTKTFSITQYLILKCISENIKVTVTRRKLTWLKATVIPDFKEVMKSHFQIWDDARWNKSESLYSFPNGSELVFIGLDETQKLHGRKQHIAWINEAMETEYDDFAQLGIRTERQILIDYNPSQEAHWIYDRVIPRDDCEFIKSTYRDNPFLKPEIRQEIERFEPTPDNIKQGTADETNWKIYGLGERAAHKGLIFAKARVVKELPPVDEWKKSGYGLDFGFSNHPTALGLCVLSQGELWLDEQIYERGLTNVINPLRPDKRSIEGLLIELGVPPSATIWADSAEPKSITEIQDRGFEVHPVEKGQDSVRSGIDILLRYNINITERSINAIKEKNNYKWKVDPRTGLPTNVPVDAWNHFWDAVRYWAYMELRRETDFTINLELLGNTAPSKWL